MRQDRFSQRVQRFLLAITCLLPLALGFVGTTVMHFVQDGDIVSSQGRRQAEHMAHTLNLALTDVEAIAMVAASVPRFVASQTGCEDRLRLLVRSIPALEFLILGDGRDEVACSSHAGLYHMVEHRPQWLSDMIGRTDNSLGPLAQDETMGAPFFPLIVRLPASVPGTRMHYVIAGISPTWLLSHLDPLTQTMLPVMGKQVVMLTDTSGHPIGGFTATGAAVPPQTPSWLHRIWDSGSIGPHDVRGGSGDARKVYLIGTPGSPPGLRVGLLMAPPPDPAYVVALRFQPAGFLIMVAGALASAWLVFRQQGRLAPAPPVPAPPLPAPPLPAPSGPTATVAPAAPAPTPLPPNRTVPERVSDRWRERMVAAAAGGVLHDVGNALATVLGNLELIERATRDSPDAARLDRYVKRATTALTAGAGLTRHLGRLARVQAWQPRGADPEMAAEAILPLARAALGPGVDVSLAQTGQAWSVNADALLLEAILLTFCLDLRQDVDGHLRIGFAAENRPSEHRPWPLPEGAPDSLAGDQVALSVTALGGIPRVTSPVLTEARYAAMAAIGGGIVRIDTPAPAARRITLLLPRRRDAALAPDPAAAFGVRAAKAGNWLILLVDDDDAVRQVTAEMLRELGHDVAEATSAADALRVCERAAGSIDLILADHAMPGTTGLELARQLRARGIGLPIVLVSGYSEQIGDGLTDRAVSGFLAKPFSIKELDALLDRLQPGEPAPPVRHPA